MNWTQELKIKPHKDYLWVIWEMKKYLPVELINIIEEYIATHNLQIFCRQINIDFLGLCNFLRQNKGLIIGENLLSCFDNGVLNDINIISQVTEINKNIAEINSIFRSILPTYIYNSSRSSTGYRYRIGIHKINIEYVIDNKDFTQQITFNGSDWILPLYKTAMN